MGRVKPVEVPAFIGEVKDVLTKVKPVSGAALNFKTQGLGQPLDVTLLPLYKIHDLRYTVYWKVYSSAEWEKRKAEVVAREARRKEIENRTVDAVSFSGPESERAHNFQGQTAAEVFFEGRRGREARNGWFSYELKVIPEKAMTLVCTYRGSEGRRRSFDIFVDGEKVATQSLEIHPGELFDFEYPLPEALTRGKQRITVKFQAHADATAGSVFDVRVIQ
jgi:hypothetical protein